MYEAFYGFNCKPFQLNPDPAFYFASKQHRRAKAYLDYGVLRNEGFIVVTGDIGAGKTTVLRGLLNNIDEARVVVGHLTNTQLDAEDTLRMVGLAFGMRVKDLRKSELLTTLEAFLLNVAQSGRRCLLVVDEAQNLSARAVEELRMLSNYQLGSQSLLQSFLVGQPEFRVTLAQPDMEQFRQRIAASCHIGPLDEEDTRNYVLHRLQCAGATDKPLFEATAFEALYKASCGVPRRINAVYDRLLLMGYLAGRTNFSSEDVQAVAHEITCETPMTGRAAQTKNSAQLSYCEKCRVEIWKSSPENDEELRVQLPGLVVQQHGDRLERLEHSLLRLERLNRQTLAALHRLVETERNI